MRVVAVVPAKDEQARVGATLTALGQVTEVSRVVLVDDGSTDRTAEVARRCGATVVAHRSNRGKAAAMTTGAARAAELDPEAALLFVDADLEGSAAALGVLCPPVTQQHADMSIAVLPPQQRAGGGFGLVVGLARRGIEALTGWTPTQPLSGMRCLSRDAFDRATPLARGWGVEVGLTVDVLRAGGTVQEVPCAVQHRVTGRDWRAQLHRARQLRDVAFALARRGWRARR